MSGEPRHRPNEVAAARGLSDRVRELALRRDYPALLAIAADPATPSLLGLLPAEQAGAAKVHLEAAQRWLEQRRATNQRRLKEARSALDRFDLTLTRALLQRLDEAYMTPEELSARDGLLLELEARALEREELEKAAVEVEDELRPRRRWWPRRSD